MGYFSCDRFRRLPVWAGTGVLLLSLLFPSKPWALEFGANKVRYHTDHRWKIFETEHFDIYYYQECEPLARLATQYAENAFRETAKIFDFVPKTRIPVFIYGTPQEFQETNITPELLPEGVGGFTEVFKNRIVVPMDGSYYEFEKVLHHELTHAFQYDLIYGEGWRSVNLFKAVFVPNWMMEGMAEWNARHWDPQGEMVLRDAILNDQTFPLSLLDSFDHFQQVYMAYKESESLLDYVSQVYGPEKVPLLLKRMAANQQPDSAVKAELGVTLDELYGNWKFFLRSQTWSRINGMPAPERYGSSLETEVAKASVSPDGRQVAYLKPDELGLWDKASKGKTSLLHRHFSTQGSGVAWSPDGKALAFCANRDGRYYLYTYGLASRKTREYAIRQTPLVYSPAWSPDGKSLVVSAFDYSTVDLYRCTLSTGQVDRLTDNMTTKSWAAYSPDGKSLYYIGEDSGVTRLQRLGLDESGMPSGSPVTIGQNLGALSSFWLGKDAIFFTSNRDRCIFNLYRMSLEGRGLTQLTDTFVDVLSARPAPDEKTFYAVLYQRAKESLYSLDAEKMEATANPPLNQEFLADHFEAASKIIPASTAPAESKETDFARPEDGNDPELVKEKAPPEKIPSVVPRLEVSEASNLVQLHWPVENAESESVESYRIYRSKAAGSTFTYLGESASTKQGRYVDFDVQTGGTYFYYVTAVNKLGESIPSPVVEARPALKMTSADYHLTVTPDILLLLAGFDSSVGFVGGGVVEMSDFLGENRFDVLGDTIPGVETGVQANYEFSQWRTTVDLNFYYYQNFLNIYDLQTGNVVNQYRNNENGFDLNFSYPLNENTRIEYGIGTQRFQGTPLYLQFFEGISNYSQNSDQWNIANYYRLSFVQDKRKGTQFWPSSGYGLNFTLLHALPVLDSNVSFANLLFETDLFADIGFLNHLVWANRFIAMTSQGPNPQTFFIGEDAPFQAFFTTIRGYGGSTFFGSNLGLFNTELRYPIATNMNFIPQPLSFLLIKDVELAGFMDAGVVSNQIGDIPTAPVLWSIGTGIRFYTFLYQRALVQFRFDVAWRLDQSAPPTFHFNLVPLF